MVTHKLDIETPDGICDTFIAYPEESGSYPAVLFLMDGFGLRPYLYEMTEKLAARGYYVLLPNLFYRVCRAPIAGIHFPVSAAELPEVFKKIAPLIQGVSPDLALRDAGAFLDFLATQKQVSAGGVGITGYCMGGSIAIRTAAQYPDRVAAVATFHAGRLATDAPESPHRLLDRVKAELYIGHADNDASMPVEQMERLKNALEQAHVRYEAEVYPGAAHGFTMADLPAYQEAALKRHWEKLFDLFGRTLKPNRG